MIFGRHAFITLICLSTFFLLWQCDNRDHKSKADSYLISFGSCNKQWKDQSIWHNITANDPDLWIWLGDIIYADTEDMTEMKSDYDGLKGNPSYQGLLKSTEVIGVWDDHDYGENNAGKNYQKKDSSKLLILDFLDIDRDAEVYDHPGLYQSYEYKVGDLSIKVVLLDVRYFRDDPGRQGGTILGDDQWLWLKEQLTNSDSDVHIIGGGIQFLPEDHRFEKWANYPEERTKFLDLISDSGINNPILISGDRHLAEMSMVSLANFLRKKIDIDWDLCSLSSTLD